MKNLIHEILTQSIKAKEDFIYHNHEKIVKAAETLCIALKNGNKILLFGNGGSAADCQHIAAEFINRFRMERSPLAAIALTTDTSVLTSIGNDYSFDEIFTKQVHALGKEGDIAIAISTSGNSPNIILAARKARELGLTLICFSGSRGDLRKTADISFCVDADSTARIQEVHILLAHMLCELTERMMFNER